MLWFRVYRDDEGRPQAEAAPPHALLGWFLQKDLAADLARAGALLALVDELLVGARTEAAGQGTHFAYQLDGEQVRLIDPLLDPPDVAEMSLPAFRYALDQWIQLLTAASPESDHS